MGWLKKISSSMEKAEKKYGQMKKDSAGARRVAMNAIDAIIPPPKKSKGKSRKFKTVKKGKCTCKCPE